MSRTSLRRATNRAGMIAEPSLRERNKAERRRRVLEAARAVFLEHGYEAATTREIAARAGVAVGTVFVYARDKRDLLMTIVNDDLEAVTDESFAVLDGDAPFFGEADRPVRTPLPLLGARSGTLDVRAARNRLGARARRSERNGALLPPPPPHARGNRGTGRERTARGPARDAGRSRSDRVVLDGHVPRARAILAQRIRSAGSRRPSRSCAASWSSR